MRVTLVYCNVTDRKNCEYISLGLPARDMRAALAAIFVVMLKIWRLCASHAM